MKACIIGYGSIGKRHALVLSELGHETVIVSRHSSTNLPHYKHFSDCLIAHPDISLVVIANETSLHAQTLKEVAAIYYGPILVEKPLFQFSENLNTIKNKVYVAYNLRFHPIIQKIRELIRDSNVLSVHIYVGQFLPTWRKNIDYRDSYSTHKDKGGGVLRDLSHELDYCLWLFGEYSNLSCIQGKFSDLEISSDDFTSLLYQAEKSKVVTINLNYLDHIAQREIIINTNDWTLKADLVKGTIKINGDMMEFKVEANETYRLQYKSILSDQKDACTYVEGMNVVKMIEAAEARSN